MTKYDIDSDDPLEMIWAVREKIDEDMRNMTNEERLIYLRTSRESFDKRLERIHRQTITDQTDGKTVKMPWE